MFELTINEKVYSFRFGLGFIKAIDKTERIPVDGVKGIEKNVGLRFMLLNLMDRDIITLADALLLGNVGQKPRLTESVLADYLDDESTDIEGLFNELLDFLQSAPCTRLTMKALEESVVEAKKEQEETAEETKEES